MPNLDGPPRSAWAEQPEQDVRPYVLTRGRTRPHHDLRLVSLLVAGDTPPAEPLPPEAHQALQACRGGPRSLAEIAAMLEQPVQVTKVIVSDLIEAGALRLHAAVSYDESSPGDRIHILEALLEGLQHLS